MAKHTAAVDRLIGRTLGRRYELVSHIARGGMATVYRAHDRQLDRVVAVKVPRPEFARDRRFSAQFRREARAAARLGHPNIVAVYDSGEERGLPYIVMEFVNGRTLRQVLDTTEGLSPQATAEVIGSVAAALDHAHQAGVVHLDVKPENVLLTAEAIKVADFGLVRAVQGHAEHAPAGTIQYVAPEVLRGDPVDGRADVYSLGVVAYECLTGRPPFDGPDREQIAEAHLNDQVRPPSRVVPSVPPAVDHAVLLATDPDPARRFRRAGDFAEALGAPRRWLMDTAFGTPGSNGSRAQPGHAAAGLDEAPTLDNQAAAPPPDRSPAHLADRDLGRGEPATITIARGTLPRTTFPRSMEPPHPLPRRHRARGLRRALTFLVTLVVLIVALLGWLFLNPAQTTVPDVTGLSPSIAKARLLAAGLRTSIGAPVPHRDVPEGMVAAQSPGGGDSSPRRAAVELRLSSGVPTVDLPDLAGETLEDASAALRRRGLHARVERVTNEEVDAGQVLRTEPPGPGVVEQGSPVTLVVSDGPPRVTLPELRGQPFLVARAQLVAAGIEVDREEVADDEVPEGMVVGTDPDAGEEVEPGSEVTVLVSTGPELVEVPDVRGRTREEAEEILDDAGLTAEIPFPFGFGEEVIDQRPAPGEEVEPGSSVSLQLGFF